ncbi:unnamed protein product [Effrenium voratum]|uniref:Uncharacterized protein n=1 Tax=Effrenium voratum TaxID=2562239 RepID=A0AA36NIE1_9DINO|nr:unnamed protein product [Effrenium voratum]
MAAGSLAAARGSAPVIPASKKLKGLAMARWTCEDGSVRNPPAFSPARRDWWDDPEWITELCESLDFHELFRYRFRSTGHINVLECQVYKSWLKHCARAHPGSRLVGLLDSRVTLEASSKGRSSSWAISHVLHGPLPYIIGAGLYLAGGSIVTAKTTVPTLLRETGLLNRLRALGLGGWRIFARGSFGDLMLLWLHLRPRKLLLNQARALLELYNPVAK